MVTKIVDPGEFCDLSELECDKILLFCSEVMGVFGTPDMEILLMEVWSKEGTHASMDRMAYRWIVCLMVSRDWETLTDEKKAAVLLHEMIHTLHSNQAHALHDVVCGSLPHRVEQIYDKIYSRETELMVDRLTSIMLRLNTWVYPSEASVKKWKQNNKTVTFVNS